MEIKYFCIFAAEFDKVKMKMYRKFLVCISGLLMVLAALCMVACGNDDDDVYSDQDDETAIIKVGMAVPDFELTGVDGSKVSSESLRGQVYILNFYETTCPDCRREFPVLQKIYDKSGEVVPIMNVPRREAVEDAVAYWQGNGLTMPIYSDGAQRLYYQFATRRIPRTYIVGADSKVKASFADSPVADFISLEKALREAMTIEN